MLVFVAGRTNGKGNSLGKAEGAGSENFRWPRLHPPPRGICGAPRNATPSAGTGAPAFVDVIMFTSKAELRSVVPGTPPERPASIEQKIAGVNLPLLANSDGLPIGVQLVGAPGRDERLLRTARALVEQIAEAE